MSRSRRRTPIIGIAGSNRVSEKQDKRFNNRAFRRKNRVKLQIEGEDFEGIAVDEVSNLWTMTKDGKFYFDPKKFPKLMRK
jgi:hypothetical protein